MIDLFRELKGNYLECLLFFRDGDRYFCFEEDSMIVGKLFQYEIVGLDDYLEVSFPESDLGGITHQLKEFSIHYLVFDGREILDKSLGKDNSYFQHVPSRYEVMNYGSRMKKRMFRLKNIQKNHISELLDKIEQEIQNYKDNS